MQNEEAWDDMFCEINEQGFSSNHACHFSGEPEDDVEVLFMMMLGLSQ
jgi:hypothetical protein